LHIQVVFDVFFHTAANMEHEWLEEEENGDAGDGNDNDMPDSNEGLPEDDVQFADHVDDELGPDEETTNEMADSMFEDLDVAAKDGVVSFAEWWAVLTRDDPEARLATQRRVFSGIDTDGDGALSRAELRANWMSNDMLFLNTNDPALLDDDADAKNLPQFGPGAVVPPSEQPVPHRYSAAVSAMAAPTPGRRDSVDFQGPPHSAAGAGDSLGVTLKNAALRLFKQRAPRPQSLNVRLMTSDSKVSWAQADRQCKSVKKRLCPDMVLVSCVYVCMAICVHTCVYKCACIYVCILCVGVHICIYILVHMYTYVFMYIFICIYIYVYVYVCIYIYAYIYICICMYIHTYISHIYTHICVQTCIYIHICIYMCMYICICTYIDT